MSPRRQLGAASLLIQIATACGAPVSEPDATGTGTGALVSASDDQAAATSDDEEPGLHVIGGDVDGTDDDLGFAFAEDEISKFGPTITAEAGEPVTLSPLWDAKTASVEPGGFETISFTPDTPGNYHYVCTILGHIGRGMIGDFIVDALRRRVAAPYGV